jgi:AraC-like DNA-binding protein
MDHSRAAAEYQPALFRRESLTTGPAGTVTNLFADLRRINRGELIAEHPERHLQGSCLHLERTEGQGTWELYRLGQDLYVVVADGVYETARAETVPGEGLLEFHLRITGSLELHLPHCPMPIPVTGPRLLVLYQPPGIAVSEQVIPNIHDSCVSLYCRPAFFGMLARRSGASRSPLLEKIDALPTGSVWHQESDLSPTLLYIGKSLIESRYRKGLRLLHAEAKAFELLCEVLAAAPDAGDSSHPVRSEREARQLDAARRMLADNLSTPMRILDVAKAVGMSESKLKRAFKARFGATVFEYGLDRRMRYALELLRCRRMTVGQVAYAVGYRHQTSFASAFHEFFGFLPSKARTQMN